MCAPADLRTSGEQELSAIQCTVARRRAAPPSMPEWLRGRQAGTIGQRCATQALDPRRSQATAVAWGAVVLSLETALALMAIGDFAANSMLRSAMR